ncbi:histidine kinase [Horticoccus luteus]|uniref:Histidine kinase n=1 Tax=Horticoccus luteus TaxID=2862869 RepID=A0A8F9XG26_9BACT|nr:histidine kinase [Horticoccus luteus]QYM78697.1 histidine kinase [Horticoccus luteus]
MVLVCGFALPVGTGRAAENELGHPLIREFSPGRDKIGYTNQAVTQDRDGFMYLASGRVLRSYDGAEWRPIVMPEESAAPRRFARAADGRVFVGGAGVIGWLRGTGAGAEFVSLADRLPATELGYDEIHDVLAVGRAVYFADAEKILRWQDATFTVIPCRAAPYARTTHLHGVAGVAYVTSPGRPLCRIAGDRLELVADDPVLRENVILLMEAGPAGSLRFLTEHNGFFELVDGHIRVWPLEANRWLAGKNILRAARAETGELAVVFDSASGSGGMRFDAAGRYVGPIDETLGLWLKTLLDVFFDREGGLWLGTTEGAFRLEWPSAVTVFDAVNGLAAGAVTGVERRDGVLYVRCGDDGFRLRPMNSQGEAARFEAADNLPIDDRPNGGGEHGIADPVACAAQDPSVRGARWVARESGIELMAPDGRALHQLPALVRKSAGKVECLLEEGAPGNRILWIGGAQGLLRVELARAFPPPVPFRVVLTTAGVHAGDELAPTHAPLRFDYVAMRCQMADAVRYQSRLEGFERSWSDWSSERTRSFTRLPAGAYRFEVRARDGDGVLSTPAAITFSVLPPWWWSGWAVAAYVMAAVGMVVGVVQWRTRTLRRHAARLEALVTARTAELGERTRELAEKNRELTRLNRLESEEKIAARLAEEKARLEVLRYQLNPHFLFNTLASISGSLPPEAATARAMVEQLAHFCRLTLQRDNDQEWTTLGAEIKLLSAYLAIEQSRWGDMLAVEIVGVEALAEARLPHFLLLPLVENALKYGCATSAERVGVRIVAARADDGGLRLEVSNTGVWVAPAGGHARPSLGIGLDNLRERLRRYYPHAHALEVLPGEGWVTVRLHLGAVPVI